MKKFTKIISLLIMLSLASCISIFMPSKQKVTIKTNDPDAKVYIDNDEVGSGRTVITKVKRKPACQVVVQTPDGKDAYYVLTRYHRPAAFYPLIVLDFGAFIYPCLIEQYVNKGFNYKKINTMECYNKYTYKTNKDKFIDLLSIKLDINDKNKDINDFYIYNSKDILKSMKEAEKSKIKLDKKVDAKNAKKHKGEKLKDDDNKIKYDDTKFSENIYTTLKKTGFIDTINKVFPDNNNTISIEGVIKKANVFHITSHLSSYLKSKVYLTWNFKNTYGEKIDSVNLDVISGDYLYTYTDFSKIRAPLKTNC